MRVLLVLLLASATRSGSITSTLLERAARENYSTSQKKFIRERKNKAGNQSKRRNAPKCVEDDVDHGCDRRPNRRNRRLVLCSYRTRRSSTRPFSLLSSFFPLSFFLSYYQECVYSQKSRLGGLVTNLLLFEEEEEEEEVSRLEKKE